MIYSADSVREAGPPVDRRSGRALVVSDGRRLVVGQTGAVIGRSRDCDIVLQDSNVSRRHAEIRPARGGWEVVDLGSTNGVVVDGRRVRDSLGLRGGEELELGTSRMRFELE